VLRASRSGSECQAALEAVVQTARGSDNLVPVVIHAVEQRATLGEVSDALRNVFGEYQDVSGT
jgi:methylmalonyl-CoA mutase, N-terminal domain